MKHRLLFLACLLAPATAIMAQTSVLRSAGTDFWTAFPYNDPNNSDHANLALYVTAENTATVSTTMYVRTTQLRWLGTKWGFMPPYDTLITRVDVVPAFKTVTIPVDTINHLTKYGSTLPYSVHITSTAPVRVFTLNHKTTSSDGVTALPTTMLDTEYVIIAHQTDPAGYQTYSSIAAFIATADSTYLRIYPSARLRPDLGTPMVLLLRRGQVYQIATDTNNRTADLTGTRVTANKPFVAMGGVERAWVYNPNGATRSRDHMIEQLLPVKYYGRTYVFSPTGAAAPNRLRVVAGYDSTSVIVNDTAYTINRKQFVETGINTVSIIRASKPVLAMEEEPSSNSGVGDPFSVLVPPMRGMDSLYVVQCPIVRDTSAVQTTYAFVDDITWRDSTGGPGDHRAVDTVITVDSTVSATMGQYKIVSTITDSVFEADSVFVHNTTITKTYTVNAPVFFDHYLTALVRAEDEQQFRLDGLPPIASEFHPTPYCDYLWFLQKVGPGTHVVSAPHGFSLIVYGKGTADSYGHVAGFRVGPDDSLETVAFDFGGVRVRRSFDVSRPVINAGQNPIVIRNVSIVGPDAANFTVTNMPSLPTTIDGNVSVDYTVRFTPDTTRSFNAFLQLCTDLSIERIPLHGVGIAARIVLNPPTTNWGLRKAPGSYDSSVTVCNRGNDSARVTGVFLELHDSTLFWTDSSVFTLQPGECRTVRVRYHPLFSGSFVADIGVLSDTPFDSLVTAHLMGMGAGRVLMVDNVDFGLWLLGSATRDSVAHVINASNTSVARVDSLVLTGAGAPYFRIVNGLRGVLIAPGDTALVHVQFLPTAVGRDTAHIVVFADVPSDDIVLTGTVFDVVKIDMADVQFNTLCVGSPRDTSVTVRNSGTSPITVTQIATDDPAAFVVTAPTTFPQTLAPGGTLAVGIRANALRGARQAVLSLTYTHAGDTARIVTAMLDALGSQESGIGAQSPAKAFAAIGDSLAVCVGVRNDGDEPLTIDSIAIPDVRFRVLASLPQTVAAGDSVCLACEFRPVSEDTVRGAASIFTHGRCGFDTLAVPYFGVGSRFIAVADTTSFTQIFSCTQRHGSITLRNIGPVDGMITSVAATDPAAPFTVNATALPLAFTAGSTVTLPVTFSPVSSGTFATDFLLGFSPNDGTMPPITAHVNGSADTFGARVSIDSTYHALAGTLFPFYINVGAGLAQLGLHTVRGSVSFDPTVMQITGYLTPNTALNGFFLDTFAVDNRHGMVTFRASHPAITVQDDTVLLELSGLALVGDARYSRLVQTVEFPDDGGGCVAVQHVNGLFTSNSICGLPTVGFTGTTTLSQNAPNPFTERTTISFSTSEPGRVVLHMVDQLGRVARTPVDADLPAGSYSVAVSAANLAPGLYHCILAAPGKRVVRDMMLLR